MDFNKNIYVHGISVAVLTFFVVLTATITFTRTTDTSVKPSTGNINGSEYNVTSLTSSDVGSSSVKSRSGAIGNLIVASSSIAGTVKFYATSTSATSSADLVFTIPANLDEGTYMFDVGFGGGLLADVDAAFSGNYLITWR